MQLASRRPLLVPGRVIWPATQAYLGNHALSENTWRNWYGSGPGILPPSKLLPNIEQAIKGQQRPLDRFGLERGFDFHSPTGLRLGVREGKTELGIPAYRAYTYEAPPARSQPPDI